MQFNLLKTPSFYGLLLSAVLFSTSAFDFFFKSFGVLGFYLSAVRILFLYAKAKFKSDKSVNYFYWTYLLLTFSSAGSSKIAFVVVPEFLNIFAPGARGVSGLLITATLLVRSFIYLMGCSYMIIPRHYIWAPEAYALATWKFHLLPAVILTVLSYLPRLPNISGGAIVVFEAIEYTLAVLLVILSLEIMRSSLKKVKITSGVWR